jgi:hypothetical protein
MAVIRLKRCGVVGATIVAPLMVSEATSTVLFLPQTPTGTHKNLQEK